MKIDNKVKEICKDNTEKLLSKANVIGVGTGEKVSNGEKTGEQAILVFVQSKVTKLSNKDKVPKEIDGIKTDVIEIGHVRKLSETKPEDHRKVFRPLQGGISTAHYQSTAGTLGLIVEKQDSNDKYILSNNHVLANSNLAKIGDVILQPSPYDGGNSNFIVARLSEFVPIDFNGSNEVDAALAKIVVNQSYNYNKFNDHDFIPKIDFWSVLKDIWNLIIGFFRKPIPIEDDVKPVETTTSIFGIGEIHYEMNIEPQVGNFVHKSGRTTGYTVGEILSTDATIHVDYSPEGGYAKFENQIITSYLSDGGDSGSIVLDQDNKIVGLLFAGSNTVTVLNPIEKVAKVLNLKL